MWATIFPIPYSDGPCLLVNIWRKYLSYLFIYFFHSNYIIIVLLIWICLFVSIVLIQILRLLERFPAGRGNEPWLVHRARDFVLSNCPIEFRCYQSVSIACLGWG